MRIVSFILALAILSIAGLPCTDSKADSDEEHVHSHDSNVVADSHNHSDGTPDDCPPFCSCECCGTPVVLSPLTISIETIDLIFEDLSFYYSSIYTYDFAKGIWHPPTIA